MSGGAPDNPNSRANVQQRCASQPSVTVVATPGSQVRDVSPDYIRPAEERVPKGWVGRLMQREGPGILGMLWRILGCEQDVMDAYQDCFCKLASCEGRTHVVRAKAYAYRTASNIAIEMIRTRRRHAAHRQAIVAGTQVACADPAAPQLPADERFPRLREAVTSLPAHLRNVVVLRDLSRMSYRDVARTLGIDPATARVYRRHAIVKLGELLGKGGL